MLQQILKGYKVIGITIGTLIPICTMSLVANAVPKFARMHSDMGMADQMSTLTRITFGVPSFVWIIFGLCLGGFNLYACIKLQKKDMNTWTFILSVGIPFIIMCIVMPRTGLIRRKLPTDPIPVEQGSGDNATTSSDN